MIVLVCFVLLYQNATDWVIYNEQKFLWPIALEVGKSKSVALASIRAFVLCHHMAEGGRARKQEGKRRPNYFHNNPTLKVTEHSLNSGGRALKV